MKAILITAIIPLVVFSSFNTIKNKASIDDKTESGISFFHGSFKEALLKAKKENKLVFMDGFAEWCFPCKMMAKNVFTNKKVGEFFNENFIALKIDMEKGEGPRLSNKYNVQAYPSLFVLNHQGKVVKKTVGYHSGRKLIEFGRSALKEKNG